jgi:prephenate dehydratase
MSAPGAERFELAPQPTLHEAVIAVHDGDVERALVPIENSLEGSVNPTLDAIAFETEDVVIVGELRWPVHLHLVAAGPLELGDIRAVVSHPQASGQCGRFLREWLPGVPVVAARSTADAVRQVADGFESGAAAIGTRGAADRYGCTLLREDVEDDPGSETRFVWIARAGTPPIQSRPPQRFKTALVFWGAGSSGPGWLVRCLAEFAERDVNLTRIESRPRRQRLGEYMFFLDLDGHADDDAVAAAIGALRSHAEMVRVLGSFPAA